MRCRRVKNFNGTNNIVWFGSYGKNPENDKALFYNPDNKHDNYGEKQESVADCLTQRLSVIKSELWHNILFGLPLLEKVKSKVTMDTAIADIVLGTYDVVDIIELNSSIVNKIYTATIKVQSIYGEVTIEI